MAELSNTAVERLLLLLAGYGQIVTEAIGDGRPGS